MLVDRLMDVAQAEAARSSNERPGRVSASNIGKCERSLWYIKNGYKPIPPEPRGRMVMDTGHQLELQLERYMEKAGMNYFKPPENSCQANTGHGILAGTPDMIFEWQQGVWVVCDWKTISNYGFQRAEEGMVDEHYEWQLETYLRGGPYEHEGVKIYPIMGLLVFLRKETSHLHEHTVNKSESRWQDMKWKLIQANSPVVPEKPYALDPNCFRCKGTGKTPKGMRVCSNCTGSGQEPGGPYIPTFPCGYCNMREHCWGKLDLGVVSGKPRWGVA